jgi:Ca2+/Na+ antiporter
MHIGRILALVGVVLGIIGLFMKSLTTEAEELLPTLSQADQAFPDGIPTIWGGLETWAQVVAVIAIIVVVVLAVRPPTRQPEDRISSLATAVIGVGLLAYAIVKLLDASDKADTLEAGLAAAAQAGAIPTAFAVDVGIGFYVLILGTALVAIGGVLGLISSSSTISDQAEAA